MSFDVFLMCVRDGEEATFKREVLEEVMGRGAINPDYPLSNVYYADGMSVIYGGDDEDIDSLMFNHFGGDTFFDRLWELADRTGSFLTWPDGECSLAVTCPEMIDQIYPSVIESVGPPIIVRSGKELENAIFTGVVPQG